MVTREAGNRTVLAECEVTESTVLAAQPGSGRASRAHAAGLMLLMAGAVFAAVIGTWLVWVSAYVQRRMAEEEVHAACRRVMPETADRCFDTVILQRGGARR